MDIQQNCALCERKSVKENVYCGFHQKAFSEIKSRFQDWNTAFGMMSWERYLETIIGLKETGAWAAEVAKFELRNHSHTPLSK
jgi:hypothetical protein